MATQGKKVVAAGGAPYKVQPSYLPEEIKEQTIKSFSIKFVSNKKL